jgi:23S rRNA (cytidine1920-2'-O)/16S rRNA (cytidine1409-2'-O)-methyltransferase
MRRRLDAELVRRGLASSRTRAIEAVRAGRVFVGGAPAPNPARQVGPDESITVRANDLEYVSRGGKKLEAALDAFAIDVDGAHCVDVGASTGGFTDCLLRRGAAHVVAIDVGRGQLAWTLRTDPRVTVLERTNARSLDAPVGDEPADVCVADLSFISLRTVAANLLALGSPRTHYVLLVKPQFEAGRERVGKGGIVRDPDVHRAVLQEVVAGLDAAGLGVRAVIPSPIRGADGNVEFLAHAQPGRASVSGADLDAVVTTAHGPAQEGEPA